MAIRVAIHSSHAMSVPREKCDEHAVFLALNEWVTLGRLPCEAKGFGGAPQLQLGFEDRHDQVDFISRRAATVSVDPEGARVSNISQSHDLLVRPWGSSSDGDVRLLARTQGQRPERGTLLEPGVWMLRNGRDYDGDRPRRDPRDEQSCWALITVVAAPLGRPQPILLDEKGTHRLDDDRAPDITSYHFTESMLRALIWDFVEFLSLPPRVRPLRREPNVVREQALARGLADPAPRRSEALQTAKNLGFPGPKADESLLRWILEEGYLTVDHYLGQADTVGVTNWRTAQ